jgi:hypothetical protein
VNDMIFGLVEGDWHFWNGFSEHLGCIDCERGIISVEFDVQVARRL